MSRFIFGLAIFLVAQVAYAQNEKWVAWEAEGDTLLSHENFSGAQKSYTKIIEDSKLKDRAAFGALYKRAVCFYSLGEFEKALKDLDVFIPAYPEIPNARLLRAFIYKELGDTERQLVDLSAALEIRTGNPDLLKWRATLYLDMAKYEEAVADIKLAQLFQEDAESQTYLGFALYNLDRPDSALMALNKAIELDATYVPAYFYGGSFCLQSGEYDLALKYLNLALRLEPKNSTVLFYKGMALVEKNQIDEGCSCLNKAFYMGADDAADYLEAYCYNTDN